MRQNGLISTLLIICAFSGNALAGDISGIVSDEQGNPIPGIVVSVVDQHRTQYDQGTTDEKGRYVFCALHEDTWSLQLEPAATPFKGQTTVSYLPSPGLNVDWKVSTTLPAVATASSPSKDTFARCHAAILGAAAGAGALGAALGTTAALGGFDGPTKQPPLKHPVSPHK